MGRLPHEPPGYSLNRAARLSMSFLIIHSYMPMRGGKPIRSDAIGQCSVNFANTALCIASASRKLAARK